MKEMKHILISLAVMLSALGSFAAEPTGEPDDVEAYKTQAERHARAYYLYRHGYLEAAFPIYRELAREGYTLAEYDLALCYLNGYGVEKDEGEAIKWFRRAADKGYAEAQVYVGLTYLNGIGTGKNYKEAARWFRRAAEQGDADGQYNIGLCYEKGYGVKRNVDVAVMWYRKALSAGNPDARAALVRLLDEQRSYRKL